MNKLVSAAALAENQFPFLSNERIEDLLAEEPGTMVLHMEEGEEGEPFLLLPEHELAQLEVPDSSSPSYRLTDEEVELISLGMEILTPLQRRIVQARFFNGLRLRQIAKQESLTFCGVKEIQRQAYYRLGKFIKSHRSN